MRIVMVVLVVVGLGLGMIKALTETWGHPDDYVIKIESTTEGYLTYGR